MKIENIWSNASNENYVSRFDNYDEAIADIVENEEAWNNSGFNYSYTNMPLKAGLKARVNLYQEATQEMKARENKCINEYLSERQAFVDHECRGLKQWL